MLCRLTLLRQTFARYQQVVLSATSGSMLLERIRCRVRHPEDVDASEAVRRYVRDPAMGQRVCRSWVLYLGSLLARAMVRQPPCDRVLSWLLGPL